MSEVAPAWRIEPLENKTHDRSAFSCGAAELDRYLREQASQDVKRYVARVFVALSAGSTKVLGFYSLSATSFKRENLAPDQAKRLPHYPVPAALLGRLAVDEAAKGQGLGEHLLMDAMNRLLLASQTLAVQAMVVEAKDDKAAAFYRKYGFVPFVEENRRLFLPMATIRNLIDR